eukprot:GEMP01008523.1.p1 GENE.GEMP01008523.1~~GEMP01008523.1.p1  ORF type:complete len:778 (-),score=176.28 GEMP01008523.1:972-3305(-)
MQPDQSNRLMVQVPEGIGPGEKMVVERGDGRKNVVVVPEGHFVGSRFLMDFSDKGADQIPVVPFLLQTAAPQTWTPSVLHGGNSRIPVAYEGGNTQISPNRHTAPTAGYPVSPEHHPMARPGLYPARHAQANGERRRPSPQQYMDASVTGAADNAQGVPSLSPNNTSASRANGTTAQRGAHNRKGKEENDLARAIAASLEERAAPGRGVSGVCLLDFMTAEDEPGVPMTEVDLIRRQIYFDPQPVGSDVCAQHALNHLCQKAKVTLSDLTRAEKSAKKNRHGGCFATDDDSMSVHGFFDIEAVKMVCAQLNLELFDVAPQPEWEGSMFQQLTEACTRSTKNGKPVNWLLGFLVYDARHGHAQHYSAICRAGPDQWLKLDSLERYGGKREVKNRVLSYAQLAHYYSLQDEFFRSWLLRWYPLIDIDSCTTLVDEVSAWAAERILRKSKWLPELAKAELSKLVGELRRECVALHLTISPDETRKALENDSSQVDAVQRLISHLQNLPHPAADNFSDKDLIVLLAEAKFDVPCAAQVLMIAETVRLPYATIYQALQLTSFNTHNTRILLSCGGDDLVTTCEQLQKVHFDKDLYMRIRLVMNEFRTIPVEVAVEALRQTYDDSHAAIELLKEFRNRVAASVQKASNGFTWVDSEMVASVAIDEKRWNPPQVLARAQQLSENIAATLLLVPGSSITIESVFSMILIEGSVEQAAAVIRGDRPQNFAYPQGQTKAVESKNWLQPKMRARGRGDGGDGGGAGNPLSPPAGRQEKDEANSNCSVM